MAVPATIALLDLSFLTNAEKDKIRAVLEEDNLFIKDYLSSLEVYTNDDGEFQSIQEESSNKFCSFCGAVKSDSICDVLYSTKCNQCDSYICKECSKKQKTCKRCHKQRLYLQSQELKALQLIDPDSLIFGSELVQKSLQESLHKVPTKVEEKARPSVSSLQVPSHLKKKLESRQTSVPSITDADCGFKLIRSSSEEDILLSEISSLYSEPCYDNQSKVTGNVTFRIWYRDDEQALYVKIIKATGLLNINKKDVNPYIKLYLLPGKSKHTKRKTTIQQKTTSPEYNETAKYKIEREKINALTLWLSVWSWDISGRNQFLGEVKLPLSSKSISLTNPENITYTLQGKEEDEVDMEGTDEPLNNGKISIALKYEIMSAESVRKYAEPEPISDNSHGRRPSKLDLKGTFESKTLGRLFIYVKNAENLPSMDTTGNNNPFVRCYLLPNKALGGKKKTKIVPRTLNPEWKEELCYNYVILEDLYATRALEITVWDNDRRGDNNFIGGLRIGPDPKASKEGLWWMDSVREEVEHWEMMLENAGEWVERSHNLRPSMSSLRDDIIIETIQDEPVNELESSNLEETKSHDSDDSDDVDDQKEDNSLSKPPPVLRLTRRGKGDHYEISGTVTIGMNYRSNILTVMVYSASGLAAVNKNKTSDPYVKLYLLPNKNSKKKTKTKKKTLKPTYHQSLTYKVSEEELRESTLWVSLWSEGGMLQRNQFLGETCIPFDTYTFEVPLEKVQYELTDYTKVDVVPSCSLTRKPSTVYRMRLHDDKANFGVSGSLVDSSFDFADSDFEKSLSPKAEVGSEYRRDRSLSLPLNLRTINPDSGIIEDSSPSNSSFEESKRSISARPSVQTAVQDSMLSVYKSPPQRRSPSIIDTRHVASASTSPSIPLNVSPTTLEGMISTITESKSPLEDSM